MDSAIYRINYDSADKYKRNRVIQWIEIHPVYSVVHVLNNWCLVGIERVAA